MSEYRYSGYNGRAIMQAAVEEGCEGWEWKDHMEVKTGPGQYQRVELGDWVVFENGRARVMPHDNFVKDLSTKEWNEGRQHRYESWLKHLDAWRKKHDITRKQAISVLFFDRVRDPDNNKESLFWAESNDFASHYYWIDSRTEVADENIGEAHRQDPIEGGGPQSNT